MLGERGEGANGEMPIVRRQCWKNPPERRGLVRRLFQRWISWGPVVRDDVCVSQIRNNGALSLFWEHLQLGEAKRGRKEREALKCL